MEKNPADRKKGAAPVVSYRDADDDDSIDAETGPFLPREHIPRKPMDTKMRKLVIIVAVLFVSGWVAALGLFLFTGGYRHASDHDHDPNAGNRGSAKAITLDQVLGGFWSAKSQDISWIASPDGRDGLMLEQNARNKDYLIVEDVRASKGGAENHADIFTAKTLMQKQAFQHRGRKHYATYVKPSADLKKVLMGVDKKKNWRHSFTAIYYILDVETQSVEPLVPDDAGARVQLATWSPRSDAIVFTKDNNMYIRSLASNKVVQITRDGGPEFFYGIPDWVYEEEVFSGNSATWWSEDGKYLAFLRTNETGVPEFPVEFFRARPSGTDPVPGEEAYPDTVKIKYPKAGAHNPVVDLQFYDIAKGDVFSVPIGDEFADDDRIINNILWAGSKVLVKETNRVSDILKVILVDVPARSAKTVSTLDVNKLDGGWFEISHTMSYVPADPANGRPSDGYVDSVIHNGYQHIGYFTPLDNATPKMLTSGEWEVEEAPSAIDLKNNLVYFIGTKESSIQRHVYSVKLDGSDLKPLTDISAEAYYSASFSAGSGYALLTNEGPRIPSQRVVSTPSLAISYNQTIEANAVLADRARKHELPTLKYGTLELSTGARVNYVERRPRHFDINKKYPVLFQQYSGPNSQQVTKRFAVDFQSYVASNLGYVVVTVDPRGTGFLGRKHRVGVRSQLGILEAEDHIAAGEYFASLPYVDESRLAIWGWSYGGFMTLKTLEQDQGRTYSYGMAVAPVTSWRFYDSIYTERYMRTPQANPDGYTRSSIHNATALGDSKRFLLMHGSADDNVHFQNSLTLLDDLDMAGVENYDVHVFPDSDHGIYFHNGHTIVYEKLNNWLINAFNGEWLKVANPSPVPNKK